MRFLDVINVSDITEIIKDYLTTQAVEKIDTTKAVGRRLQCDVFSQIAVPAFAKSCVDGYAIIFEDSIGASETTPVMLETITSYKIGEVNHGSLKRGYCQYIVTGAMIPSGCSAVVKVEDCELFGSNVLVKKTLSENENIIGIGEDFSKSKLALPKNTILTNRDIAFLLSLGISEVEVTKTLRAVVISTGNELVKYNQQLTPAKIYDTNTFLLASELQRCGIEVVDTLLLKDDYELFVNSLEKYDVDLYLTSGGSSKGNEDYTKAVFEKLTNNVICHGINLKPGKPTVVAKKAGKLYLGLPGNPLSAYLVLRTIISESLRPSKKSFFKLSENVHSDEGKSTIVFVKISGNKAQPLYYKSSYLNVLASADGYFIIDENVEGIDKDCDIEVNYFE